MTADAWTAAELQQALWRHYSHRCAVLFEVSAPDLERRQQTIGALGQRRTLSDLDRIRLERHLPYSRRVDALLWGLPGGSIALELKVTRSDYLADVREPDKQRVWRELAGRHAYVVPAGLVERTELPADSGLLRVERMATGGYHVAWEVKAPRLAGHTQPPLPDQVLAALAYRCARAEAHLRGLSWGQQDDPEKVRAERDLLRAELDKARSAEVRLRERLEHYRRQAARAEAPPCASCGHGLRASYSTRAGETWRHLAPEQDDACHALREAQRDSRRAAGDRWAYVEAVRPRDDEEATA